MHVDYATQYELGRAGEREAAQWYEDRGYRTLGVRVRMRAGEIDVIVEACDGTIVFVEVKSRNGRSFGAAEAVTSKKLATMRRCAAQWLDEAEVGEIRPLRFDVVECIFADGECELIHYEGVEDGAC